MKKAVFIVYRSDYYRFFSRIIESLFSYNILIEIWYSNSDDLIDPPFSDKINSNINLSVFRDEDDLSRKIKESVHVDLFFSLHPFSGKLDEDIKSKIDNRWMIIMHGLDSYLEIRDWHLKYQNKYLEDDYRRHFFPYTNHLYEIGTDWLEKHRTDDSRKNCDFLSSKKTFIHFSEAPFLKETSAKLKTDKIKEKYFLDPTKKVLVYLPFPFSGGRYEKPISNALHAAFSGINHDWIKDKGDSFWNQLSAYIFSIIRRLYYFLLIFRFSESRRIYLNRNNEEKVIEQIRIFCDVNNFIFVVKKRKKFSIPKKLDELADLVIMGDNNEQNPSEFQELSKVSDLTIGYTSTAVLESIFYKTPFVNISFPKKFYGYGSYSYEMHTSRKGFIYNIPGAVYNFNYEEFISNFAGANPSFFNLNLMSEKQYKDRFLGREFIFDNKNFVNKVLE